MQATLWNGTVGITPRAQSARLIARRNAEGGHTQPATVAAVTPRSECPLLCREQVHSVGTHGVAFTPLLAAPEAEKLLET